MSEGVYGFFVEDGDQGCLEGLFIAKQEDVERLYGVEVHFGYGVEVHFGECLGKYSEVSVTLDEGCFELKSTNTIFISQLRSVLGVVDTISGYNPLEYTWL